MQAYNTYDIAIVRRINTVGEVSGDREDDTAVEGHGSGVVRTRGQLHAGLRKHSGREIHHRTAVQRQQKEEVN